MSNITDSRVVEMRFDNSNFEKNCKQTLNSLDQLDSSLKKFDGKNVNPFEGSSAPLAKMGEAIDNVKVKIDTMGLVFTNVLSDMVIRAERAGERFVKSLSIDQVAAGWEKYAEKTQAVQMIVNQGYDMAEVDAQLEKLNWFTDETSYSFMDMVSNIGKFTAQGQELEKSVTAMEGISTWAALSGAGITGASRAMYNLSQALGMGSVRVQDWMSVENANMATKEFKETVMETARELGKLDETFTMVPGTFEQTAKYSGDATVSVANFRTTLSAGWFDTEVLMGTLQKYGDFTDRLNEATEKTGYTATEMLGYVDKFKKTGQMISGVTKTTEQYIRELSDSTYDLGFKAFKAAQEATTFKQAIDSIKDASSTAFMTMFETVFGNYEKAKRLWTDLANGLYEIFVDPLYNIQDTLSGAFTSGWDNVSRTLSETGIATDELQEKLIAHAEKYKRVTREEIEAAGGFYESLQNGWLTVNTVKYTLRDYVNELSAMSEEELAAAGYTQENIQAIREYQHEIGSTTIDIQSYVDELRQMSEEGRASYTETQIEAFQALSDKIQTVDGDIDDHIAKLSKMSDAQLAEAGYTRNEVYQLQFLRQKLGETEFDINSFLDSLDKRSARDNFIDAFWVSFENLKGVIDAVKAGFRDIFPAKTSDDILAFSERVLELSKRIKIFDEESGEFTKTGEQIRSIFRGVASVFSIVKTIFSSISKILSPLTSKIGGLGEGALGLAARIGDVVTAFADWLEQSEFVQAVTETLRKTVEFLVNTISTLWSKAKPAIDKFASTVGNKFSQLGIDFDELGEKFLEWINETELFDKAFEMLTNGVSWAIDNFPIFIENVKKAWEAFRDNPLQWVIDKFNELKEKIKETINNIDGLKDTKIAQWFADLKINIQPIIDWLGEKLPPIFEKIKKALTFENALTGFTIFYLIERLIKTYKKIQNITKIGDSVKKAIDSIKKTFDSITGLVKTKTKQLKANNFLKYCSGIAVVVGAIVALAAEIEKLANIPPDIFDVGSKRLLELGAFVVGYQLVDRLIQLIPINEGSKPIRSMTSFVGACVILAWEIDRLAAASDFKTGMLRLVALGGFIEVVQIIQKTLSTFESKGGTKIFSVIEFIGAILLLGASVKLLATMDQDVWLRGGLRVLEALVFLEFVQYFEIAMGMSSSKGDRTRILSVIGFVGAILLLGETVKLLANIGPTVWAIGVERVLDAGSFLIILQYLQNGMANESVKDGKTNIMSTIAFVGLIYILGEEVRHLGEIDPNVWDIGKRHIVLCTALLLVIQYFENGMAKCSSATSMTGQTEVMSVIGFMAAIGLLAIEVSALGKIEKTQFNQGYLRIVELTAIIVVIQAFEKELAKIPSNGGAEIVSVIGLVIGIGLLGLEAAALGNLNEDVLKKGILSVAVLGFLLAGCVAIVEKASDGAKLGPIIASLILFAGAMYLLGLEATTLGLLSEDTLMKGVGAISVLGLVMGISVGIMEACSKNANIMPIVVTIGLYTLMVGALALMAVKLGELAASGTDLDAGLAAIQKLAIILGALTAVGGILAAIPAVSENIVSVGGGMALMASSILILAAAFWVFTDAVIALLPHLDEIKAVIPVIAAIIFETIGLIIAGVAGLVVELTALVVAIITAVCAAIIETTPIIIEALKTLLEAIMVVGYELLPQLEMLVLEVIATICATIAASIGIIVETGWTVLLAFLQGISDHMREAAAIATEIIANLIYGISDRIGDVVQAGVELIISFIEGLATALGAPFNREKFKQALKDLLKAGWESLKNIGEDAADIGKNIIQGIKNGIENFKEELFGKMRNLASKALGAAKRVLGIESPSKAFMEVGKFVDLGFAKGIEKYEDVATVASEDMAMATLDTVSDTLGKMSDIIADNEEINPTITPILDLSEIQNGSRKLDSIFNNRSVNGTVSLAENISNGVNSRAAASYAQPSIGDLSSALSAFTANPGTSQTNTFNIYGDDPKAIADEVSVILAKQVERNRLAWA